MITKAQEAKRLVFQGVNFDVLAVGAESMVTKIHYEVGDYVPFHSHPNEQSGYVISDKYCLKVEEQEDILTAGDSFESLQICYTALKL